MSNSEYDSKTIVSESSDQNARLTEAQYLKEILQVRAEEIARNDEVLSQRQWWQHDLVPHSDISSALVSAADNILHGRCEVRSVLSEHSCQSGKTRPYRSEKQKLSPAEEFKISAKTQYSALKQTQETSRQGAAKNIRPTGAPPYKRVPTATTKPPQRAPLPSRPQSGASKQVAKTSPTQARASGRAATLTGTATTKPAATSGAKLATKHYTMSAAGPATVPAKRPNTHGGLSRSSLALTGVPLVQHLGPVSGSQAREGSDGSSPRTGATNEGPVLVTSGSTRLPADAATESESESILPINPPPFLTRDAVAARASTYAFAGPTKAGARASAAEKGGSFCEEPDPASTPPRMDATAEMLQILKDIEVDVSTMAHAMAATARRWELVHEEVLAHSKTHDHVLREIKNAAVSACEDRRMMELRTDALFASANEDRARMDAMLVSAAADREIIKFLVLKA